MNKFLHALNATHRKRVPLDEVRAKFFDINTSLRNDPARNQFLLDALRALENEGEICLPAKGSWEKSGCPPLPNWIALNWEPARQHGPDYSQVPWVPELGFWPDLRSDRLADAMTINDFLLKRRGSFIRVPIKERSLEIFGDEKKLDALEKDGALFSGRLSLASIGAFRISAPLPYRMAKAPGKPILVLENHNSYWSFGEWNQTAKRYAAVVYGGGNHFSGASEAMAQVLSEVPSEGIEYLGDLDPKGMRIPMDFNKAAEKFGIRVAPALDYYQWLLLHGKTRTRPESPLTGNDSAIQWLGETLGKTLMHHWEIGLWMPQEALGFEQLMRAENCTFRAPDAPDKNTFCSLGEKRYMNSPVLVI